MNLQTMMAAREQFRCDELFLIFDTAKHNGIDVAEGDVTAHINGCSVCSGDALVQRLA